MVWIPCYVSRLWWSTAQMWRSRTSRGSGLRRVLNGRDTPPALDTWSSWKPACRWPHRLLNSPNNSMSKLQYFALFSLWTGGKLHKLSSVAHVVCVCVMCPADRQRREWLYRISCRDWWIPTRRRGHLPDHPGNTHTNLSFCDQNVRQTWQKCSSQDARVEELSLFWSVSARS